MCVQCGLCPPGNGLKSACTKNKDTVCWPCIERYDYSEDTSMDECIHCNAHSNCASEAAKVIRKCSVTAPPICDGCVDGYFYDTILSNCRKCLECLANEYEEGNCTTSHDRKCAPSSDPPTVNNSTANPSVSSRDPLPTVSPSDNPSDSLPPDGSEIDEPLDKPQQATSGSKGNTWIFVLLGTAVPVILLLLAGFIRYKSKRGTLNQPETSGTLMLNSAIGNLPITKKKVISSALNGKDVDGFFYWQRVSERLGYKNESRGWSNSTNPTNNLLRKYSEKQGSTLRGFLKALKEEDLIGLLYCNPDWKVLIDNMDTETLCDGDELTTMAATHTSPV